MRNNKEEQERFVKMLSSNVVNSIISNIHKNKIPDNWDGMELRELLADAFKSQTFFGGAIYHKRSKRYRDYKKTVLRNNLI